MVSIAIVPLLHCGSLPIVHNLFPCPHESDMASGRTDLSRISPSPLDYIGVGFTLPIVSISRFQRARARLKCIGNEVFLLA
jgi:hypothetical protein